MMLMSTLANLLVVSAVPLELVAVANPDAHSLIPQIQNFGYQNITESIASFALGIPQSVKVNLGMVKLAVNTYGDRVASSVGQLSVVPFVQSVTNNAFEYFSQADKHQAHDQDLDNDYSDSLITAKQAHLGLTESSGSTSQKPIGLSENENMPSPPVYPEYQTSHPQLDTDTFVHFARGFMSQML